MEIKLTDEQLDMLLKNETFMKGLIATVANNITDTSWGSKRYEILSNKIVQAIKGDITRSMINNRLVKNESIVRDIDKKVEDSLQKIIATAIGRTIFKELINKETPASEE